MDEFSTVVDIGFSVVVISSQSIEVVLELNQAENINDQYRSCYIKLVQK